MTADEEFMEAYLRRRYPNIADMFHPVRHRGCGKVFDGGMAEVVHRYADCSVVRCPGCNGTADDRPGIGGLEVLR